MKKILILCAALPLIAGLWAMPAAAKKTDNARLFFDELKKHCGNAYEGAETAGGGAFGGEKLVMHVRSCKKNEIKIPFFVGENKSRTWILTLKGGKILLKHDHRHQDGTPEEGNTMYGGPAVTQGSKELQIFPADQQTLDMLPATIGNVWWIELSETSFTYNLRRVTTDRHVAAKFDFSKKLQQTPSAPWGWKD
ncbi:MAG: hypothetical protein LBR90_02280 [Elusimicrobiota bacterium]|jgi:hypothetical protein|nr:hypothetical protein [Elusimicrobiota bacterium]